MRKSVWTHVDGTQKAERGRRLPGLLVTTALSSLVGASTASAQSPTRLSPVTQTSVQAAASGGDENGPSFERVRGRPLTIWETIPPTLYAQSAPPPGTSGGEIVLDTITVEGQGGGVGPATAETPGYQPPRDVNISSFDAPPRELPVTVNVLPQQFIRDRAAERLRDVVDYIPGVNAPEGNGGTGDLFIIRGFETNNIAVNGLRRREFSDQSKSFANIDRVEILKGAAGLEVGIVEPGGIVNFVTKKPQPVAAHTISADAGNFDRYGASFDSTGPVAGSSSLFYRFVSEVRDDQSFRDNAFSKRALLAPSFLLNYGEGSSALLELEYNYLDQPYDRGIFYLEGAGFPRNFAPIRRSLHEPTDSLRSHQGRAAFYLDHKLSDSLSLRGAAEYLREDGASRGARNPILNGLYLRGTNRFSGNPFVQRSFNESDSTGEQLLTKAEGLVKFTTGPLEHQSILGLGWSRTDLAIEGQDGQTRWPINAFAPVYRTAPTFIGRAEDGVGRAFDFNRQSTFESVYAQHKVDVWQRLHLIGGVRFDHGRFQDQYTNNVFTDPPGEIGRYGDSVVSYRVGAAYDLTDAVTVFATYSNALEPQRGQDRSGNRFEPLEADNYEGGLKVGLFGGRALLTASAFHITRVNIAEPDPANLPGETFRALVGTVRVRGAEAQLTGNVTEDLEVLVGASYLDAEITESTSGQKGNRPYGVPPFQGSAWGKYRLASLGLSGFSAALGLVHVGEREGDNANSFQLPAYARVDAAVFYEWRNLKFRLAAENLFDEVYYIGSQNRPQNVTPGSPFRVTAGVSARF